MNPDSKSQSRRHLNLLRERLTAGGLKRGERKLLEKRVETLSQKIIESGDKNVKEMAEIVIDAFKEGDYPQGKFGAKELAEIQETYNPDNYEAPILIGHLSDPSYKGKSTIPAFGWVGKVKVVGNHLKLIASQFSDELKEFIKRGLYKKVSAAFYEPTDATNPTPGKWHLHHLAFLGGVPPAVKGLEGLEFSVVGVPVEMAEMDAEVTMDGMDLGKVEEMAVEDTVKNIDECFAMCSSEIETHLKSDMEPDQCREMCLSCMNVCMQDVANEIHKHCAFAEKIDSMETPEEEDKMEMMERLKKWLHIKPKTQSRKETDMEAKEKQEYETKIVELQGKLTAFEEEKRRTDEAKVAATTAAKETEKAAKIAEIKTFCEQTITANKMTPAEREKDEPIMVSLIDSPDVLKSFREKYSRPAVPAGETNLGDLPGPVKVETVLDKAAAYVKAHGTDKEFADCQTNDDKVSRAVFLKSTGKINF